MLTERKYRTIMPIKQVGVIGNKERRTEKDMIDTKESLTAKLCSFARAYHSNHDRQKIFNDYLAFDMMGKDEYEEIGQLVQNDFDEDRYNPNEDFKGCIVYPIVLKYVSPIPLSRAAFAGEKLKEFAEKYGKCQYVICGAGMDTFAFRNENPDIEIFELDHPDTQRYKMEKIKELQWNIPQNVHYVPIDFSKEKMGDVLKKAGFQRKIPTFVSILGVTYYLSLSVFASTIGQAAGAADICEVVFDFPDETTFTDSAAERVRHLSEITARLGEPMTQGFSVNEMMDVLCETGFTDREHMAPADIQDQYFKDRNDGQYAFENIHFIAAERRIYHGRI